MEDDVELERIRLAYTKGEMLTGELKKIAIEIVQPIVLEHQEKRKNVTDSILDDFMKLRKLNI